MGFTFCNPDYLASILDDLHVRRPDDPAAPQNEAAWALEPKTRPLVVGCAPYNSPPPGFVTVKVNSVAVNPIDWIMQDQDVFKAEYPTIFGLDIAGTIEEVGENICQLKPGQRVIAHAGASSSKDASRGGFQKYVVVSEDAVAELPQGMAFETGVVLPLGISTAAAGLYERDCLSLPFPRSRGPPGILNSTRALLIWGGSSSVGSCAIQMAFSSGAVVFTTASRRNFDYVKRLGAYKVFDYHDDDVEDQIVDAMKNQILAGVYHAVGADGAVQACARIADRSRGKALVVTVRGVPNDGIPPSVRVKAISSSSIFKEGNNNGHFIWRKYLPAALSQRSLVPKPDPLIVGSGLGSVQLGLDTQKAGVSARKVVVNKIDED